MTREDIIRMAKEAGFEVLLPQVHFAGGVYVVEDEIAWMLERFAALVAAKERAACAAICDEKAKEPFSGQCQVWGDYFARAIRARGEA